MSILHLIRFIGPRAANDPTFTPRRPAVILRVVAGAAATLAMAACSSVPMNRDALRQHAERDCRVQATVSPAYAIDSTGVGTRNVAFDRCMASRGFRG